MITTKETTISQFCALLRAGLWADSEIELDYFDHDVQLESICQLAKE